MNILGIVLIVIVVVILIFLVSALFAKKDFTVERELTINKPRKIVFDYVRYLKNHRTFSKWTTKDPSKITEVRGTDGTKGFVQSWDNYAERAGVGELEIKRVIEDENIVLEHRYFKPVKGQAIASLTTELISGEITKVKWVYTGISSYPLNLLTAVMNMDKLVGKDLEEALYKLKLQLESSPA
jgi:hypothetical protein